jgi:hypothetical protein
VYLAVLTWFVKKTIFSSLNYLDTFLEIQFSMYVCSSSRITVLKHWYFFLFVHQYHLITLNYVLNSGSIRYPTLWGFLPNTILAILSSLNFHINLESVYKYLFRKPTRILIKVVLNLKVNFSRMDILVILMSSNLWALCLSIWLGFSILWAIFHNFQHIYRSYICFIKSILEYFIFSNAIVFF